MIEKNQDEIFVENAFKNLIEIYFNPEIERRKENKTLDENFELYAAQALIFPDERQNIIRLNDEVSTKVKIKEGVDKSVKGFFPNSEDVESIDINEEEYLDCGHVIIIRFTDCYQLKFDFVYNKKSCKKLLDNSIQFLKTADYALNNDFYNAYIDNAFSAFELMVKANLLFEANKNISAKSNHKAINQSFNLRYKNSSHEDELELRRVFNKLSNERRNARYLDNEVNLNREELIYSLERINNFYLNLINRINKFE